MDLYVSTQPLTLPAHVNPIIKIVMDLRCGFVVRGPPTIKHDHKANRYANDLVWGLNKNHQSQGFERSTKVRQRI